MRSSLVASTGLLATTLICGCGARGMFPAQSISSGVAMGHVVHRVMPTFPVIARSEHVSGAVTLAVVIDAHGDVSDIEPVAGPALLVPAYIEAVRQWKYRPFEQDGVAVSVRTTVNIHICFGG